MQVKALYKNYIKMELSVKCQPHHLLSTIGDNLIESCGRICYDSFDSPKSRNSVDYHKHINDVGHGSVQEHFNFTASIQFHDSNELNDYSQCLLNRPGVWAEIYPNHELKVTPNIRAAIEWRTQKNRLIDPIGDVIQLYAKQLCPMACENIQTDQIILHKHKLVSPETLEEKWISFRISEVSRNLTHELVRHKFRTAVSQRSSRFVDESESKWAWHPLINQYREDVDSLVSNHIGADLTEIELVSQVLYDKITNLLQDKLTELGSDKLSARKQARGAARGILGSCLSTELIFSASVAQWIRICEMRSTEFADAEIRLMANKVWEELETDFPEITSQYNKVPCKDNIGYGIIKAT